MGFWHPININSVASVIGSDFPSSTLFPSIVSQGLADYQAKLSNAKDDYEKASAQIGIEVTSAMNSALGN